MVEAYGIDVANKAHGVGRYPKSSIMIKRHRWSMEL